MPSKKIVIFSEDFPPYPGGIAQWAFGMANALHRMGHEIHVLTRQRPEYGSTLDTKPEYPTSYIEGKNWKKLRTWYCYRTMNNFYREGQQADLLLATTWNVARGVVSLARKNGTRVVTVVHGLEITRRMNGLKRRWLRKTLLSSDRILAVSRFIQERIVSDYQINPDRIMVLPCGVDTNRFISTNGRPDLRDRYRIGNGLVILTLARVIERKGHDQVIEALPLVREKIPEMKYVICGPWEDSYYQKLQSKINDLQLGDSVIFTGYVSEQDISAFHNLCDVYIMPSRELSGSGDTEGFGIAFLEANACGKPVIGGRSGGVVDAIVDGETGFLVDPMNPKEIGEKLILLLSDPELALRLGQQGRARVEEHFTWDIIAKKMCDAIFE